MADAALGERVVVKLDRRSDQGTDVRIHPRMLYPVFLPEGVSLTPAVQTAPSYLRFEGSKITARDDNIVANFQRNAAPPNVHGVWSRHRPAEIFSGVKALVGRQSEIGDDGGKTDVDVYVRVIVDWTGLSRRVGELTLYPAAFVISQIPSEPSDRPTRETFYRFLPNQNPFRMLICTSKTGEAT